LEFAGVLQMAQRHRYSGSVSLVLIIAATAVMAVALYFIFSGGKQDIIPAASQISTASGDLLLSRKGNPPAEARVPSWLILLVSLVTLAQIFSLMIADRSSRETLLTRRTIRKISFLCETPMYFGLLGSLLGICATQWTTGSLAAPLAYLTTITGIILHLFGKFAIVLALPDISESSSHEEA